jgi:heme/copper-type cytochrome/quinol oxidase subunit 2
MGQLSQLLSKLGGCLKNVLPSKKFLTKVELFVRITVFIVVKVTHGVVFVSLNLVCCFRKRKKKPTKNKFSKIGH